MGAVEMPSRVRLVDENPGVVRAERVLRLAKNVTWLGVGACVGASVSGVALWIIDRSAPLGMPLFLVTISALSALCALTMGRIAATSRTDARNLSQHSFRIQMAVFINQQYGLLVRADDVPLLDEGRVLIEATAAGAGRALVRFDGWRPAGVESLPSAGWVVGTEG